MPGWKSFSETDIFLTNFLRGGRMTERRSYEFGPFRLDAPGPVLFRNDQMVPLAPKAASTLLLLVQNAGKTLDKDDLLKEVWPDEAAALLQHVQEINPEHFLPHMRMGLLRIQQKRHDEAIRELETSVRLADRSTETLAELAMAYASAGQDDKAEAITSDLEAQQAKRYVLPYNFAKIYAAWNKPEKAFEWLEKSYDEGSPDLIELNSEPIFDRIRSHPKFVDLMRRVGWKV